MATAALLLGLGACTGEATPQPTGTVVEGAAVAALAGPGRAEGFDLLLVTLDTVRADRLGCNGYPHGTTPRIDALASTGVNFGDVTAPAPITLPSHASLFTGLPVPGHGVRNNGAYRLADEHLTLAESLREAGYETGAFVGSFVLDGRYGVSQGFDHYDDDTNPGGGETESSRHHERPADVVTDAALAWLAERPEDARLFTWVHYFDAHRPWEAPAAYLTQHPGRGYDAEIAFADAQLGRLIDHLAGSGRLERTLVVVTADHGEGLGEHGEQSHSLLIYESTMHVPLILSNPGLFDRAWVVDDRVGGLVDLAPTLLELLGLPALPAAEGRSLFTAAPDPQRAVYIESMVPLLTYGWAPLTGLRRHADKHIDAPVPEYFRLDTDPREQRNLWDEAPAQAAELAEALATRSASWGEVGSDEPPVDAETLERLAALGYVRSTYRAPGERKNPRDMVSVWDAISKAEMLSQRGEHAEALATITRVVRQDPEDGRALYMLALIHRRREDFAAAEEALVRSVACSPDVSAYILLAQLQVRRGDAEAFDRTVETVRALEPDNGRIEITVGDRLAMEGRFDEALLAFERALRIDPVRVGALAREKIALARQRLGL